MGSSCRMHGAMLTGTRGQPALHWSLDSPTNIQTSKVYRLNTYNSPCRQKKGHDPTGLAPRAMPKVSVVSMCTAQCRPLGNLKHSSLSGKDPQCLLEPIDLRLAPPHALFEGLWRHYTFCCDRLPVF